MAASSEQVTALIIEMENIARQAIRNSDDVVLSTEGQLASMREISNVSQGLSRLDKSHKILLNVLKCK